MKEPQIKALKLELKNADISKGEVAFYFSAFGNKDSDGDIVMPGAFTKTIKENFPNILHFRNHDRYEVPGVIKSIEEDSQGTYAVSALAVNTIVGKDTHEQYKAGIIKFHSMGFIPITEQYSASDNVNYIKEIKLMEVSSLTAWGANEKTPMIGVKNSKNILSLFLQLQKSLEANPSEIKFEQLKTEFNKLSEIFKSLETPEEEPAVPEEEIEPIKEIVEQLKSGLKF